MSEQIHYDPAHDPQPAQPNYPPQPSLPAIPAIPAIPANASQPSHTSIPPSSDIDDEDDDRKKSKRPVSASIPKGVRYLKKSDGEPFWRKDIQYDFLAALFENDQRVFTNPFAYCSVPLFHNGPKYTFAELYVRTLAESPKCSKILKERLLRDWDMGKSVAKVCLLVNTGRMNTTINFVPEMRSTLRTYHSIPSLQADPNTGASKPLQDTPRLKSILKAVSDVHEDFKSIEDLLSHPPLTKPNTNLVFLLFLLSNNINGIKFHHEHTPECQHVSNTFMEFFLETKIHPANRAKRFLWLMYTYLETNFTPEELAQNPFNPNEMPPIEYLSADEVNNFDKDTDYEIEYSEKMFQTRLKYLADEEHNNNPKRGNKAKKERDEDDEDEEEKKDEKPDKKRKKVLKGTLSPVSKAVSGFLDYERRIHGGDIPTYFTQGHLTFPVPFIDRLKQLNEQEEAHSMTLDADEWLTRAHKRTLILHLETRTKKESLFSGLQDLQDWIIRFFQYKKSVGNGLVDMEWEEIRYDILHGIEDYLYQNSSTEEKSLIYEPRYDYDLVGEKSDYVHALMTLSRSWLQEHTRAPETVVSFDLDNEKISIS